MGIRLHQVGKIYRRSHLGRVHETVGLSELSLEIAEGEVFGLLGLNGAGKTTAIKLILGLHYPTHGRVEVQGRLMPDLDVLGKIGYLPEAAYLNKYLTGREIVRLFATLSRIPASRREQAVEEVLDKVGMSQSADTRVSEYSKGMLQRISIAQALVHDPEILIFDEPITGLDPLAVQEFRKLVLWLKACGKTVFFSSHDISEVEKVSDRIGILASGRLVRVLTQSEWAKQEGKLEQVFSQSVQRSERVGPMRL